MNKVNAQQARRVLDRLVGYKLSPLLWDKVRRGLSAGRVQSVAMKMIVDREDEIKAFVPEEYWTFAAKLAGENPPPFIAKLTKVDGKKADVTNEEQARDDRSGAQERHVRRRDGRAQGKEAVRRRRRSSPRRCSAPPTTASSTR